MCDASDMNTMRVLTLCTLFALLLLHLALCTTAQNVCTRKSPRWKDLGGELCYLIEKDRAVPWIEAVYDCYNEGGSLASFHSMAEVQRVLLQINDESKRYYIGLWKYYDGSLHWVDESDLDFRNWDYGEPNYVDEKCVEMYYDSGKWNDARCSAEMGYICSSPKSYIDKPRTVPEKVCPFSSLEWQHFGGETCYLVNKNERITWTNAMHHCTEEGGALASFHSVEEVSAVVQLTKASDRGLHIGLRKGNNGNYNWVDRSPLDLDYWKSGEPNDAERRCTEMDSQSGQWDAIPCGKVSGYICSAPRDTCGGDINSDSGSIHSPMYPRYAENSDCTWTITVPEDQKVALQFQTIELEDSRTCRYDYVEVRDGIGLRSPVLGRFCGRNIPPILRSSGKTMSLRFHSDSTGNSRGFLAKFTKVRACGYNTDNRYGVLHSPNYPQNYGPGVKCVWHITLREHDTVDLKFTNFNVEESDNCTYDFVEVYDGHDITKPVLGKFCGTNLPSIVRSTDNEMTVVFASDISVESSGFSAEFRRGCGGNIVSESGIISSQNYPANYDRKSSCTWKITVPEGHQIVLQFDSFDVEASPTCNADFVEIRDGHESDGELLGKVCGNGLRDIYRSSTNKMTVRFVSDSSIEAKGFLASFTKVIFPVH